MAAGVRDFHIGAFIPDTDTISTGPRWEKWIKQFETRLRFFKINETQDKVDALSIYGGETIANLIEILPEVRAPAGQEDPDDYDKIINKLNSHFVPMANPLLAEYRFGKMSQRPDESITQYYVRVKEAASKCEFDNADARILAHMTLTIIDANYRRHVIAKKYDLKTFLEQAAAREDTDAQANEIEKGSTSDTVQKIYTKKKYSSRPGNKPQERKNNNFQKNNKYQSNACPYCGGKHSKDRTTCPASRQECRKCHKFGHFERVCRSNTKSNTQTQRKTQSASHISTEDCDSSSDSAFRISTNNYAQPSATVKVRINGIKANMDADSCSSANILDEIKFNILQDKLDQKNEHITLTPADTKLYAFANKEPLPLLGCFNASVQSVITGKQTTAKFLVVQGATKAPPLLSLNTSLELGLISITNKVSAQANDSSVNDIIQSYPEVFSGLGKHSKITAKFIVDETVTPVIQKQHKIPYNLAEKASAEEDRLLKLGIIERVPDDEPTSWCVNPVIAPKLHKPEAIRYCSNMRVPNTAIKRPIIEAMTVDDIKFQLSEATVFSVLDMNEAYHQIELAPESRHLTTFYGVNSKMRYTRLNYGTISAQDIFDKAMDDTVSGIQGVLHIRDDFIVYGKTQQDHNDSLKAVLQRFKDCNLTLGKNKCKFNMPEVEFFGFVFSKDGIKPATSKIEALQQMAPPHNKSDIQSLLGMAQYSSRFIPNFSNLTAPLRKLTYKDAKWSWGEEEEKAFTALRTALSDKSVLGYYEIGQQTELHVDAGPHGLGAIIVQMKNGNWTPVVCVSRSLTPVEERYSQLEREALAIRWACERCYTYLIGSTFTVITDHKPLVPLFNNPNSRPPLRLERWLMYLQQFDFKLQYKPGKDNAADYLSRHPQNISPEDIKHSHNREAVVSHILSEITPKAIPLECIQKETKQDVTLQKLAKCIKSGDQKGCKQDPNLRPYHLLFPELSIVNDVIIRGNQIVIPAKLQQRVISLCHEGHQGIVKTKSLLRSKVWFPGIDRMVEQTVQGCIPCQAATQTHTRDPLQMSTLPRGPWVQVSVDFCGPFPSGEMALVVIDEYSRFPELEFCTSTSAAAVIPKLNKIFATHGIPEILKSDNGPPFNGKQFSDYAEMKGFVHRKITPLWPEANAQAENFMKTLQKAARTAHVSNQNWKSEVYNFLLNYRATPHTTTKVSPFELLMNRKPNTKVPQLATSPTTSIHQELCEADKQAKQKMKYYADRQRHTKPHDFVVGDIVLVKQTKSNKLTTPFHKDPYVITKVKGSMIIARRRRDNKTITRNCSQFKHMRITLDPTPQDNKEIFPEIFIDDDIQRQVNQPQVNARDDQPAAPVVHHHPQRNRRQPGYLADFVK